MGQNAPEIEVTPMSLMCRFLDAGNDERLLALGRPASKKRKADTRRRACLYAEEPTRVQQASRRARGVHQWAVGGLMDGIGSKGGNSHRRTPPQLPRLGMNVAQEGI